MTNKIIASLLTLLAVGMIVLTVINPPHNPPYIVPEEGRTI